MSDYVAGSEETLRLLDAAARHAVAGPTEARLDGELHFVLDRPPSEERGDSSPLSRDIPVEIKPA